MRPEERLWQRIAKVTGSSPSRAKCENSATDLLRWKQHFDEEWVDKEKWEHYLAEIRYQLHLIWLSILSFGGKPDPELLKKTVKDFYCNFVLTSSSGAKRLDGVPTSQARQESLEMTKMVALAYVGLNPDGSKPEGRTPASKKKPPGER